MVATAVNVIDNARSDSAIKAITLEATPPGQEPISTTPAAISAEKPKVRANTGQGHDGELTQNPYQDSFGLFQHTGKILHTELSAHPEHNQLN